MTLPNVKSSQEGITMRQLLSLLLAFAFTVQVGAVSAQAPTTNPTFAQRISDVAREIHRLETSIVLESTTGVQEEEVRQTNDSIRASRFRVILETIQPGTKIEAVLRDRKKVQGRLAEVTDTGFSLFVPADEDSGLRGARGEVKKKLDFEQLEDLEFAGSEKLLTPDKAQEMPQGEKVEVLLLDGGKTKGRLAEVTADSLVLTKGNEESHELAFDEIAAVRKTGMSTPTKILLIAGLSFLAVGLFASAMFGFQGT
jgi:ribosome maturation factor RimP